MADEQNPQLPLTPPGGEPPQGPGAANIIPINVEEEMRRSYLDYSMSVIIGRALPDVRDGLKPVHRRVLYTMNEMGLQHNKKYTKCAKVVGQAMGQYHPHGDTAIYDTLVRLAQDFSLRYPLVDGQGNFGSVDGDPPAAMRYTECRLQKIAGEMLSDIDKETVDFVPNYDESTTEPTVLPTRIPNLLINGSNGIAVGMATNIPPHNLTEIVDATITLVQTPQTTLKEVLKIVKGPDFPTGGFIYGRAGIEQAYTTGRGRFQMRAKAAIENLIQGRQANVVTEIPYQVNKSALIKRVAELVNDKVIKLIRGSASRTEAREALLAANFKITDKQIHSTGKLSGRQADAILDLQLYRLTRLSTEEIFTELTEIRDRVAEYESILASEKKLRNLIVKELEEVKKEYGDERRTMITDEGVEITLKDLVADEQVAVTVSHSGYLKRTALSTYRQQRRGGMGRKGMSTREEDFVEQLLIASTHAYLLIFTSAGRMYWLKVYEIPDVGPAGKGKAIANLISLQPGETVRAILNVRDLEEEGKHVFFATRKGTVKKTPLKDFSNVMSRGIIAIGIDKDDELVAARVTDGNRLVFLASHDGMAIRFEEADVRPMGRPAYGVRGMHLEGKDYIVGMALTDPSGAKKAADGKEVAESEAKPAPSLILSVTENGYGKRTDAEEYRLISRGGKGVINVKTTERNGKVVAIMQVEEDSECMLISQYGKIIRLPNSQIRETGRNAQGVRLLHLDPGDRVAAAVVIPPEEKNENDGLLQ